MRRLTRQFRLPLIRNTVFNNKTRIVGAAGLGMLFAQTCLSENRISNENNSSRIIEYELNSADIVEGQMLEVKVGQKDGDNVLVTRVDGKVYCTSNKCTHVGAPLAKGLLVEDRVICPFHAASFSVKTGAHEYGPVYDGLAVFETVENAETQKVMLKVDLERLNKGVHLQMSRQDSSVDKRVFVMVGGGPASLSCAETLRQSGYQGRIVILTDENVVPYDRTMLTKAIQYSSDSSNIQLRNEQFLKDFDIELMKNQRVSFIDYDTNKVFTNDGSMLNYDKILVATGGSPIRPPINGIEGNNIFSWRNVDDLQRIKKSVNSDSKVVIVGASFIGMEAASSITKELKPQNVTVVDMTASPFERVLGNQVGDSLKSMHENQKVEFQMNSGIKQFKLDGDGNVQGVVLANGESIQADAVILGTGIRPNVGLFPKQSLDKSTGGVQTDLFMKTSLKDTYAAGDIASIPYWYTGQQIRLEHYNEAIYQGQIAAFNMLGKGVPIDTVPFFYTRQFDKSLAYTGYAKDYDQVQIDGDLSNQKFLALYSLNDRVLAVAGMQRNADLLVLHEAIRQNIMPKASEFQTEITIDDIKTKLKKTKCQRCRRVDNTQK